MSLKKLSDKDLNRLYNDAKSGIRRGNYQVDNDGDDVSGYQQTDFYTGQTMSSDYNRNEKGKDEEEMMELSKMYRDNVYTDYKGGRLTDMDIRRGFNDIFDEKGYITVPPCVFGDKADGLMPARALPFGTRLFSMKKCKADTGHHGEMSLWQTYGVFGFNNMLWI